MVAGSGTILNVGTVLAGSAVGLTLGDRLPERIRLVVIDGLGLVVALVAGLNALAVNDPALRAAVGAAGPTLIVLGAMTIGGVVGSALQIERRLQASGAWLQRRFAGNADNAGRQRFIEGFVTASLVFCVGPLTILGALSDGLHHGIDQLALKSTLDGVAAMAFAAVLGVGVMASAATVLVVQGTITVVGVLLGQVLSLAAIASITATGGLLLFGVALRLLRIRDVPVADLLPALVIAPVLVTLVSALR